MVSESTWGYPIIGAIHVLGMALMGGAVFVGSFDGYRDASQIRAWKWITVTTGSLTGILLFASNAVRYGNSRFFDAKMVFLILLVIARRRPYISVVLWILVIFASRGIAFF